MKYIPICVALSIAILYIVVAIPLSVFSSVACVALGLALLYFASQAKPSTARTPLQEESPAAEGDEPPREEWRPTPDTALDDDLVARILEELKKEPSEQLREMLAQATTGNWSPEALQAARLVLDQRSTKLAREPMYRSVPRAEEDQISRENEAVAPGFSRELLTLDVGSRVYCPWRSESGTIVRWDDKEERFYIRYDNGEGQWATLGMFE